MTFAPGIPWVRLGTYLQLGSLARCRMDVRGTRMRDKSHFYWVNRKMQAGVRGSLSAWRCDCVGGNGNAKCADLRPGHSARYLAFDFVHQRTRTLLPQAQCPVSQILQSWIFPLVFYSLSLFFSFYSSWYFKSFNSHINFFSSNLSEINQFLRQREKRLNLNGTRLETSQET